MKIDISRTSTRFQVEQECPCEEASLYKTTIDRKYYQINVHSLEELFEFIEENHPVIIHKVDPNWDVESENEFEIEIYDTFRE